MLTANIESNIRRAARLGRLSCLLIALWAVLGLSACGPASNASSNNDAGRNGRPGGEAGRQKEPEGVLVRAEEVRVEPMSALYSTSATLRASQQATVTARTRGVIRRLQVEEGDRVRAGQTLAMLEDDEQRIAAERSAATLETERSEHARAERLYGQKLLSEEAYEIAKRELADAQHAADLASLALARTVIQAPFSGVILARELDTGASVSDGTPVYRLANLDLLYADVDVPERQVIALRPDQEVRLEADATGEAVQARIERISPEVKAETGTVRVVLAVRSQGRLRPGSFVRANVVTDQRAEALTVPRQALVAEGRRWAVYRLTQDEKSVDRIEVSLGYEGPERVEVLAGAEGASLSVGERVVVAGAGALADGAAVRLEEETSEEAEPSAVDGDEAEAQDDAGNGADVRS